MIVTKGYLKRMWSEFIHIFNKYRKLNVYERVICLSVGISALLIIIYTFSIGGKFSNSNADWGDFGSFLGSLTGLLAFASALYAIDQSNKRMKEAEERSFYNSAVETYYNVVKNIRFNDKVGDEAIAEYYERVKILNILFFYIDESSTKIFNNVSKKEMERIRLFFLLLLKIDLSDKPKLWDNGRFCGDLEEAFVHKEYILEILGKHVDHNLVNGYNIGDLHSIISKTLFYMFEKNYYKENIDRYYKHIFSTLIQLYDFSNSKLFDQYCQLLLKSEIFLLFYYSFRNKVPYEYIDLFRKSNLYLYIDIVDLPIGREYNKYYYEIPTIKKNTDVKEKIRNFMNDIYNYHEEICREIDKLKVAPC